MNEAEKLARELLAKNKLCVLATASLQGVPEAATIKYAEDEQFNLYFETLCTNRKYNNLVSNPKASVVVTEKPHTLQIDGSVEEMTGLEGEHVKARLIAKDGPSVLFDHSEIRFFRFTPTWIRIRIGPSFPPQYFVLRP